MCDRKDKDEFDPFQNYLPPITFGAGQVVVDGVKPRTFAAETTPEDADEFYSQAGGVEERITIATLKQTFGPEITSSIGYVPSASGNANNRNEFVIDPNGARWFIDFDGDAIQFAAGGATSWTTLTDIPVGFADNTDNVNDADASTTNETITSLTYNPATGAYQIVEAGTTRTLALGKTIACSDEGTALTSNLKGINFVGAGVTVTEPTADSLIVTIPGGAGGGVSYKWYSTASNEVRLYATANPSTWITENVATQGEYTIVVPNGQSLDRIAYVSTSGATRDASTNVTRFIINTSATANTNTSSLTGTIPSVGMNNALGNLVPVGIGSTPSVAITFGSGIQTITIQGITNISDGTSKIQINSLDPNL
jgi:hypothetical protein